MDCTTTLILIVFGTLGVLFLSMYIHKIIMNYRGKKLTKRIEDEWTKQIDDAKNNKM